MSGFLINIETLALTLFPLLTPDQKHDTQKHGRIYGIEYTSLAFGNG